MRWSSSHSPCLRYGLRERLGLGQALAFVILLPVQAARDEVQALRAEPDLRPQGDGALGQVVLLDLPQREATQDAQSEMDVRVRVPRHPGRREGRRHAELEAQLVGLRPTVGTPGFLQCNEIRPLRPYRLRDRPLAAQPSVAERPQTFHVMNLTTVSPFRPPAPVPADPAATQRFAQPCRPGTGSG